MKTVDCKVIQDLLPSYIDKISSDETNELIEKHLQNCEGCRSVLNKMKNTTDIETSVNQEEIDYLKGYRKKKIKSIIITILFTIFAIIDVLLALSMILTDAEFYLNVYDVSVCYRAQSEDNDKKTLSFEMISKINFIDPFSGETHIVKDEENHVIYCKLVGKFSFGYRKSISICGPEIDDSTEAVYLVDKKGAGRKIWDKEHGVLTRSHLGPDLFVGM